MLNKILLIEDDIETGILIRGGLQGVEDENWEPLYDVFYATNLNDARLRLDKGDIDLLISDTCVDSKNRPDAHVLIEEVRQRYPNMPILGMSSSDFYRDIMLEAGCNRFYTKSPRDLQFAGLLELVQELLP